MSSLIPTRPPSSVQTQPGTNQPPPATPQPARPGCLKPALVAALCLVYVLSPLDIMPDVIPVIGWVDDVLVLLASLGFITHQTFRRQPTGK